MFYERTRRGGRPSLTQIQQAHTAKVFEVSPKSLQKRARDRHAELEAAHRERQGQHSLDEITRRIVAKLSKGKLSNQLFKTLASSRSVWRLAQSLLWFFRFDTQPRTLPRARQELVSPADILPLVKKPATKMEHANKSKLLKPGGFAPLPTSLRELPQALHRYHISVQQSVKNARTFLTASTETWRARADRVIYDLVSSAEARGIRNVFEEVANLLTDAAAVLELMEPAGEPKIFSGDEIKKRFQRHARKYPANSLQTDRS